MKNILTTLTLLAAGTSLASATISIDALFNDSEGVDSGNAANMTGFQFSLGTSSSVSAGDYYLDSLGFAGNKLADSSNLTDANTIVFYSVSEDTLTYVGNATVDTSQSYVIKGLGYEENNSSRYTINNGTYALFTPSSKMVINSETTYAAYFVTTEAFTTNTQTFENATAVADISSYLQAYRGLMGTVTDMPEGNIKGTAFNTGGARAVTTFSPYLTASITAIPEPSAFGLIAGMGALALVAARRRRSR